MGNNARIAPESPRTKQRNEKLPMPHEIAQGGNRGREKSHREKSRSNHGLKRVSSPGSHRRKSVRCPKREKTRFAPLLLNVLQGTVPATNWWRRSLRLVEYFPRRPMSLTEADFGCSNSRCFWPERTRTRS